MFLALITSLLQMYRRCWERFSQKDLNDRNEVNCLLLNPSLTFSSWRSWERIRCMKILEIYSLSYLREFQKLQTCTCISKNLQSFFEDSVNEKIFPFEAASKRWMKAFPNTEACNIPPDIFAQKKILRMKSWKQIQFPAPQRANFLRNITRRIARMHFLDRERDIAEGEALHRFLWTATAH